jgi:biotin carboxylase
MNGKAQEAVARLRAVAISATSRRDLDRGVRMTLAGRPRLLLVGMGLQGRGYLRCAHDDGVAVSILDHERTFRSPKVQAMLSPDDRTYVVSEEAGLEEWLAAAGAALAEAPADGVVAFSEPHVLPAAFLADELGLPGPGLRASLISRNKFLQREAWRRAGLRQPDYRLASNGTSALAWAAGRFPVVTKPLDQSGSRGVRIVSNEGELRAWVDAESGGGPFLCEELMSGPEYSCEVLVHGGEPVFTNVTAKLTTAPPYFVEIGHRVPARCGTETHGAITCLASAATAAIGMQAGIAHVEMRVTDANPQLMEVAVRTPGDFIMDIIGLASGVDLFESLVAISLGRAPQIAPASRRAACVWYPDPPAGSVAPVEALQAAAGLPGVVRVDVEAEPGSLVSPLRWSLDRVGSVVVQGDDDYQLDDRLDKVRALVSAPVAREGARGDERPSETQSLR